MANTITNFLVGIGFDYDEGANFKLKIKKVAGWSNYDSSIFAEPTPIGMGKEAFSEDELDELDKQLHKLAPVIDPKVFPSYEEMAIKFTKKTGIPVSTDPDVESSVSSDSESSDELQAPKRTRKNETPKKEAPKDELVLEDEDEDDEAFFNNLAND